VSPGSIAQPRNPTDSKPPSYVHSLAIERPVIGHRVEHRELGVRLLPGIPRRSGLKGQAGQGVGAVPAHAGSPMPGATSGR